VFLNIAKWVQGGWIKIGDRHWRVFAASALNESGIWCVASVTCENIYEGCLTFHARITN
jgi:hypothetical protein